MKQNQQQYEGYESEDGDVYYDSHDRQQGIRHKPATQKTNEAQNTSVELTTTKTMAEGNDMPMDERNEFEDTMKALGLCDYTNYPSTGVPDFCATTVHTLQELCYGVAGGTSGEAEFVRELEDKAAYHPKNPTSSEKVNRAHDIIQRNTTTTTTGVERGALQLSLSQHHATAAALGTEEQTAIEVEYVEPVPGGVTIQSRSRTAENVASPKRTTTSGAALMKSMFKKKHKKHKTKNHRGVVKSGSSSSPSQNRNARRLETTGTEEEEEGTSTLEYDETASLDRSLLSVPQQPNTANTPPPQGPPGASTTEDEDLNHTNVYATFTSSEKSRFLSLINQGETPFDATQQVLQERRTPEAPNKNGPNITAGDGGSLADDSTNASYTSDYQPRDVSLLGPTGNTPPSSPERNTTVTATATNSSSTRKSRTSKLAFWKRGGSGNDGGEEIGGEGSTRSTRSFQNRKKKKMKPKNLATSGNNAPPSTPKSPVDGSPPGDSSVASGDVVGAAASSPRAAAVVAGATGVAAAAFSIGVDTSMMDQDFVDDDSSDELPYDHGRDANLFDEEDILRDLNNSGGQTTAATTADYKKDNHEDKETETETDGKVGDDADADADSGGFKKSGINYYDAIQKDYGIDRYSDNDADSAAASGDEYYYGSDNNGISSGGTKFSKHRRKLKIPSRMMKKGGKKLSHRLYKRSSHRGAKPVLDEDGIAPDRDRQQDTNDGDNYDQDDKEMGRIVAIRDANDDDDAPTPSSTGIQQQQDKGTGLKTDEEKEFPAFASAITAGAAVVAGVVANQMRTPDRNTDANDDINDVVGDIYNDYHAGRHQEEEREGGNAKKKHSMIGSASPPQVSPSSVVDEPTMQELHDTLSKESLLDDTTTDGTNLLGMPRLSKSEHNNRVGQIEQKNKSTGRRVVDLNPSHSIGAGNGIVAKSRNPTMFDVGSVVSGTSLKTSQTNMSTRSTRSRRPGQAKVRLAREKQVQQHFQQVDSTNDPNNVSSLSYGSISTASGKKRPSGWRESIETAAAEHGKIWDPETGWKDYSHFDPSPAIVEDPFATNDEDAVLHDPPVVHRELGQTSERDQQEEQVLQNAKAMTVHGDPYKVHDELIQKYKNSEQEQHPELQEQNALPPHLALNTVASDDGQSLNAFMNENDNASYADKTDPAVGSLTNGNASVGTSSPSRRRRKAAATAKIAAARNSNNGDAGSTASGWKTSMMAAAANVKGKNWDPDRGWDLTEDEKNTMLLQQRNTADDIAVTADSDTHDFGTTTAIERSSGDSEWAASMTAAAAKLNIVGKRWDPIEGWVAANEKDEPSASSAIQPITSQTSKVGKRWDPIEECWIVTSVDENSRSITSSSVAAATAAAAAALASPSSGSASASKVGKRWDPIEGWVVTTEEENPSHDEIQVGRGMKEYNEMERQMKLEEERKMKGEDTDEENATANADEDETVDTLESKDRYVQIRDSGSVQSHSRFPVYKRRQNEQKHRHKQQRHQVIQEHAKMENGTSKSMISVNSTATTALMAPRSVDTLANKNGQVMVDVQKETLDQADADFFPTDEVTNNQNRRSGGPVDLDEVYEEELTDTESPVSLSRPDPPAILKESNSMRISGRTANEVYRRIYEQQNTNGSFDAGSDFSWEADNANDIAGSQSGTEGSAIIESNSTSKKAVPRLKFNIRDSSSVSSSKHSRSVVARSAGTTGGTSTVFGASSTASKAMSEGSFESSSVIPKLSGPKRDTSPIRITSNKAAPQGTDVASFEAMMAIHDNAHQVNMGSNLVTQSVHDEVNDDSYRAKSSIPSVQNNRSEASMPAKVSKLHSFWEKRTASWDDANDLAPASPQRNENTPSWIARNANTDGDPSTQSAEWKSFLGKKMQAESEAAVSTSQREQDEERDTIFDFPNEPRANITKSKSGEPQDSSAFDDISTLSPIRQDDDSDYSKSQAVSEASTAKLQGNTFFQRIQACASSGYNGGNTVNCNSAGSIASHLSFLRHNPGEKGQNDKLTNSTPQNRILQVSSRLCGRPDVIAEEDEATIAETVDRKDGENQSSEKPRSQSNPRSKRNNKDDLSSVISDGFGAKSAYLEAIAMRAAVSSGSTKKKRRSPESDASASTFTSKKSDKFQQFLERRSSKDSDTSKYQSQPKEEKQMLPSKEPPIGRPEVSVASRAERYASEKMNAMMDSMAGRGNSEHSRGRSKEHYEETGAFPTTMSRSSEAVDPTVSWPNTAYNGNDAAREAAEELAAARVEVMMKRLSARDLGDDEAEI